MPNKMVPQGTDMARRGSRPCAAFTMVEMLTVIAIVTLLAALLLPTLGRMRERARRVVCANNLHQIGTVLFMYGSDNRGALPQATGGGNWLWDMPYNATDLLLKYNIPREILYCPSARYHNIDTLWYFTPTFRVTGYFFLTTRIDGNYPGLTGGKAYQRQLSVRNAADTEIVMDSTISQNGYFFHVYGGYGPDRSSHFDGGPAPTESPNAFITLKPAGGNILYMDGHVAWRKFSEMAIRTTCCWPEHWF